MKKRIVSLILILTLTIAFCVSAFAVSFPDLENHWAKDYMTSLVEQGYLKGYTDGTIKPEGKITTCESLVFLSRLYSPTEQQMEWIREDYLSVVQSAVPSSLKWAYDELCVCLATGIVSSDLLARLDLTSEIEKEVLSVFLVRAIEADGIANTLSGESLDFNDKSSITTAYLGYIEVLAQLGIVQGDTYKNFSPHLTVSRAVVSTMYVRALQYLKEQKISLEISGYTDRAYYSGVVTAASASSLVLTDVTGVSRKFTTAGANITVNDKSSVVDDSLKSYWGEVGCNEGAVSTISAKGGTATYVQGRVYATSTASGTSYITLTNLSTGTNKQYKLSADAEYYVGSEKKAFADIAKNQFATLRLENNAVTLVTANTCTYDFTGKISAITYGTSVTLDLLDDDGVTVTYQFAVSALPAVYRGTAAISFDRLVAGDTVTVSVLDCEVKKISLAGTTNSITGTLTTRTSTLSGESWVITDSAGKTYTLTLDESAQIYEDGKTILLSAIKVGDSVTVVTFGSTITEVHRTTSSNTQSSITAPVLNVDATKKQLTVLLSSKLITVDATAVSYVIDAQTGKSVSLANVEANSTLTIYGEYTSTSEYKATTILVVG
jgi:hypothetical protein